MQYTDLRIQQSEKQRKYDKQNVYNTNEHK